MYQGSPNQRWGHISYAQHGDDLMFVNIFEQLGIKEPSYLDIGAHHPIDISNTHLLYTRGSTGVNVEANPNLIAAFRKHRPKDMIVNCGVGIRRERMPFYLFDEEGGRNTFSENERDLIIAEGRLIKRELTVDVLPINSIVDLYCGGKFPHLLNMDIEGWDYKVLESADFNASKPEVICVETRSYLTQMMKTLLSLKGYTSLVRMGENLIFVKHSAYSLLC